MVARPGTYQASNNAGELAPQEYGRTDLKQFYAGLATALNIEPVPQGGSQLAMRTRHLSRIRKGLIAVSPVTTALPSGSYAAAAVLATVTFLPAAVSVVRVSAWNASQALGAILQLEYLLGGGWISFGAPFTMGTDNGTVTIALPPGESVFASGIRLRMVSDPPSATSFTVIGGLVAATETGDMVAARIRPFTFSLDQTYVAVIMGNHIDFYRDGVYVGASSTNFGTPTLATLDVKQRFDTMLLFHPSVASERILRDGSDSKWLRSDVPFLHVPVVDLGGIYTNQVTDVWGLYVTWSASPAGALVVLFISGEQVSAVSTGVDAGGGLPDWSLFADALQAAIAATAVVGAGVGVSLEVSGGTSASGFANFSISFGAINKGATFTVSSQITNTVSVAATVSHNQLGVAGGEALISDARGFAACADFYQDRLLIGGFNSKKSAWAASITGEYYDYNIKLTAASGAILANLDTNGAEQLQRIVADKYLLFFTSDAEYFVADRALDRTKPPTIVNSSRYGSASDLPVVANEGEVIFASRNKAVLYAGAYDAVSTSYQFTPISLLAPHIVNAMVDMALQRPSGVANAARLWMPRDDGSMTVGVMLRNQDITAFVRWATDGLVTSACVDGKNVPHLLVQRTVAGVDELHFERLEDGLIFDGVVEQNFDPPQTQIANLGAHEGAMVWAQADGYVAGPFTVAGGIITLADAASNVKVGRWTPPLARTLPLPSEVAERVVLRRPKRVHTVRLDLVDTTSLAVGANDQPARNVALAKVGDPIDAAQALVNETVVVTGLVGFTDTGQVDITQTKPGRLAWRGITIEART